jgi:hypothetical protein
MSNLIDKLAAEGHLTSEQANRIQKTVAEFQKLAAEDPEFHQEAMEKLAWGESWVGPAKTLGTLAGVATAMSLVGDAYDTAKGAIMKSVRYKRMVDANPQLKDQDPKLVQSAFNTLHTFNPDYASDPAIAGEFVSSRVRDRGMDFGQLKNIIDAGKSLRAGKRPGVLDYVTSPQVLAGIAGIPGTPEGRALEAHEMSRARHEQAMSTGAVEQAHQEQIRQEQLAAETARRGAAEQQLRRSQAFNKDLGVK